MTKHSVSALCLALFVLSNADARLWWLQDPATYGPFGSGIRGGTTEGGDIATGRTNTGIGKGNENKKHWRRIKPPQPPPKPQPVVFKIKVEADIPSRAPEGVRVKLEYYLGEKRVASKIVQPSRPKGEPYAFYVEAIWEDKNLETRGGHVEISIVDGDHPDIDRQAASYVRDSQNRLVPEYQIVRPQLTDTVIHEIPNVVLRNQANRTIANNITVRRNWYAFWVEDAPANAKLWLDGTMVPPHLAPNRRDQKFIVLRDIIESQALNYLLFEDDNSKTRRYADIGTSLLRTGGKIDPYYGDKTPEFDLGNSKWHTVEFKDLPTFLPAGKDTKDLSVHSYPLASDLKRFGEPDSKLEDGNPRSGYSGASVWTYKKHGFAAVVRTVYEPNTGKDVNIVEKFRVDSPSVGGVIAGNSVDILERMLGTRGVNKMTFSSRGGQEYRYADNAILFEVQGGIVSNVWLNQPIARIRGSSASQKPLVPAPNSYLVTEIDYRLYEIRLAPSSGVKVGDRLRLHLIGSEQPIFPTKMDIAFEVMDIDANGVRCRLLEKGKALSPGDSILSSTRKKAEDLLHRIISPSTGVVYAVLERD